MPLDGHSYLVGQGWGGKGTGLRQGAISRPLAIPQKKNLAGLGKDRDEAFPFWDHLFTAAAKSIQVKCLSDDEEQGHDTPNTNDLSLKRTSTGIFSTRRPIDGTHADSGTTTPNEDGPGSQPPRLSLMAQAKRDAAKRGLYSRFFRGPVLGPESISEEEKRLAALVLEAFSKQNPGFQSITVTEQIEVQMADERVLVNLQVSKSSKKKRKATDGDDTPNEGEDDAEKKERKKRRQEEKRKQEGKDTKAKRSKAEKTKEEIAKATLSFPCPESTHPSPSASKKRHKDHDEDKSERRLRKEEKKRLKAVRKQEDDAVENAAALANDVDLEKDRHSSRPRKKISPVPKSIKSKTDFEEAVSGQNSIQLEKKKKKRKRKPADNSDESS